MRPMTPQPINHKYRTGRRVMLAGVILLAVTQLCGFLPTKQPNNLPINWTRITTFIPAWVWVVAWGVVLVLAIIEIIRGKGRYAISGTVAMCAAAGTAYLVSYAITVFGTGWGSREWFYFGRYASTVLIILGLLVKVGALKTREDHEQ